jgi:hypothetical protein
MEKNNAVHKNETINASEILPQSVQMAMASFGYLPEDYNFEAKSSPEDKTHNDKNGKKTQSVKNEGTIDKDKVEKTAEFRVFKADDEKQIVMAVVIEPEKEDTQGDWMSAEDIEKTAHLYLTKYRVVGKEHEDIMNAHVVESYIAPSDIEVEGEKIKKGTWVLGVHVAEKEDWQKVKKGEYNAFSVGGWGLRE